MKDATVMFLSRISDGSAAKDCGVRAVGLQRAVAEGVGKIEINYISRGLCFRPPEFPTTKQKGLFNILTKCSWEGNFEHIMATNSITIPSQSCVILFTCISTFYFKLTRTSFHLYLCILLETNDKQYQSLPPHLMFLFKLIGLIGRKRFVMVQLRMMTIKMRKISPWFQEQ